MVDFASRASTRVILFDGGMGTQIQGRDLTVEEDFWGQENCSEILNLSRPDLVTEIHRNYLLAGADAVETNTFGGSPVTLAEFDLQDRAFEINQQAARLARAAIESLGSGAAPRYVVGSIGPGTKLPSLGHIAYRDIEAAITIQTAGLMAGGVDALLIETCQDPLQVKAAINGVKNAFKAEGRRLPILVQVTIETTGTMLVGTDIAAAIAIVDAMDVDGLGLNCATGPKEMAEHVRQLGQSWPRLISIQPNAGLPELKNGQTHYPLGPEELARWLERFISEDGVNMVGGCCGTTPEHIRAIADAVASFAPREVKNV